MPLTIYFGHELTEKDLIDYGFHNDLMQYKIQNQIEYMLVTDPPNNTSDLFNSELEPFFRTLHPYVFNCSEWRVVSFRNEHKFTFIIWK